MASRFKSLFPWSSNLPDNLPRGRSYEPPISSADYLPQPPPPPQVPARDALPERPRTAPQKAATWDPSESSGRTRSGFSMKSPPAFLASSRKNSLASTRSRRNSIWSIRTPAEAPPPVPSFPNLASLPPLPQSPAVGSFTTASTLSPPPTPDLPKERSHAAPKPYIDLLAAHSTIKAAQRSRPLVVRDYGEHIADRNIASFGERAAERQLTPRPRPKHIQIRVQGDDGMRRGEAQPDDAPPSPRTTSIRSFTGPRPGIAYPPRSDSLRSDHTASASSVSGDERVIPSIVVQDRRGYAMSPLASPATSVFEDFPSQAYPPRPVTASPTRAAPSPPIPERSRQRSPSVATVKSTSPSKPVPPLPSGTPSRQASTSSSQPDMASLSDSPRRRARARLEAGGRTAATSITSRDDALPARSASGATHSTTGSNSNISFSTANGSRTPRTASPHSISTHTPSPGTASTHASRKRASSRNGSVSYSAFPSCAPRENRLSDASTGPRSSSRRRDYAGSRGIPDLAQMGGRENTVETDVTTNIAPAVQHEEVILKTENVQHEAVTIETHTHEFHHRILPVTKTEILPTKHYAPSEDGKSLIEIPESLVPQHSLTGNEAHNWHVAPGPGPCKPAHDPEPVDSSPGEAAAPPVISLVRDDARTHSRRNSTKSVKATKPAKSDKSTRSRAKSLLEPILASKKEYMTDAGYPRTEYVWHHPPVTKTDDGQAHPIYIGAGLGDLSRHAYSSDEEEDLAGARFGAEAAGGGFLFRESDYQTPDSLPGLAERPRYDDMYGTTDTSSLTKEMRKMRM